MACETVLQEVALMAIRNDIACEIHKIKEFTANTTNCSFCIISFCSLKSQTLFLCKWFLIIWHCKTSPQGWFSIYTTRDLVDRIVSNLRFLVKDIGIADMSLSRGKKYSQPSKKVFFFPFFHGRNNHVNMRTLLT